MKRQHLISIVAMVIIALALIIRALLFLHPHPGDGGTKIHVRFQNIDKITKGTKVTFAGKPVGEVEKILIIQNAFNERPSDSSVIYPYELILAIDSSITVYKTDIITVKTEGLLGEKFIAIIPQPGRGDLLSPILPGEVLYAYEPTSMDDTFRDISNITKKADSTFDSVFNLIQRNQESVYQTTTALERAAKGLDNILTSANDLLIIPEISQTVKETRALVHSLNNREGTLGSLIKDPRLYNQATQCLEKTDFLIDSLGLYGLFFHTNPTWQRVKMLQEKKQEKLQDTLVSNSQSQQSRAIIQEISTMIQKFQTEEKKDTPLFIKELQEKITELEKIESSK